MKEWMYNIEIDWSVLNKDHEQDGDKKKMYEKKEQIHNPNRVDWPRSFALQKQWLFFKTLS